MNTASINEVSIDFQTSVSLENQLSIILIDFSRDRMNEMHSLRGIPTQFPMVQP